METAIQIAGIVAVVALLPFPIIIIHELGHMLCGRLIGLKKHTLILGGLDAKRHYVVPLRACTIYIARDLSVFLTGCYLSNMESLHPAQCIVVYLGGPLASLALAYALWQIPAAGVAGLTQYVAIYWTACVGVGSLYPGRYPRARGGRTTVASDGQQIIRELRTWLGSRRPV